MEQPLVSIIMPVYNAQHYLPECMESARNQTLENIEIICVNDGSTDSSLDLLMSYKEEDSRIVVIDKPNAGYGHTMNRGLEAATGKYVAFLESDDRIEVTAYEKLFRMAEEHNLDIIKGNYYFLYGSGSSESLEEARLSNDQDRYNTVFTPLDEPWSFYIPMMNCLGLFSRKMLEENAIRHNETPGAAHQDLGFWFQTMCSSKRMMLVDEPFYIYRQDNQASSINNDKATFTIKDEYDFIWNYLSNNPSTKERALALYFHRKYTSSMFSYGKSELSLKLPFIRSLAQDYRFALEAGEFCFERFNDKQRRELESIIEDPDAFYLQSLKVLPSGCFTALREEIGKVRLKNEILLHKIQESPAPSMERAKDELPFSIIIPVYNSADYLEDCLNSILNQGDYGFEVICVNDGSTDNSLSILESIAERDPRVKVFSQDNQGQGAARNLGLSKARGCYIQFVDSDDLLPEGSLSKVFGFIQNMDLDVLLCNGTSFYETEELAEKHPSFKTSYTRHIEHDGVVSGVEMFKLLKKASGYRVPPYLALFSRSHLMENHVKFPEGIIYEDNVFFLKALLSAKRTQLTEEVLYLRRVREGSVMTAAITAHNVLSYFEVYLDLLLYCVDKPLDMAASKAVADELRMVQRQVCKKYRALSPAQKIVVSSMSPVKQTLMDFVVKGIEEEDKRKALEKKLKRMKKSMIWKTGKAVSFPVRIVKKLFSGVR